MRRSLPRRDPHDAPRARARVGRGAPPGYALGLGVPFIVIAAGLGSATAAIRVLARNIRTVNVVGGTLVIAMGLLLVSGQFTRLAQLFNILPLIG